MFVSWGGKSYSCNPRVIAETILKDDECKEYDLNYAFFNPENFLEVPPKINKYEIGSLEYFYKLATSKVIVANILFSGQYFPKKRKRQIYIQTQHGGRGIKKIDFDDAEHLSKDFLNTRLQESKRADLLLSESAFRTKVIRSAFRYEGEVLEMGLPRNNIFFFPKQLKDKIRCRVREAISIPHSAKCLIYTPTFRGNGRRDVYGIDIQRTIKTLEERFGGEWYILIASHPNMKEFYQQIYDFSNPRVRDVGRYENFQELLLLADILITDYSSAEFDFSLQKKPIFSLVKDADSYDRGLYILPKDLPFPYAENDEQLCENIRNFDSDKYLYELNKFESEIMGLCETGHAAEAVVEWIKERTK